MIRKTFYLFLGVAATVTSASASRQSVSQEAKAFVAETDKIFNGQITQAHIVKLVRYSDLCKQRDLSSQSLADGRAATRSFADMNFLRCQIESAAASFVDHFLAATPPESWQTPDIIEAERRVNTLLNGPQDLETPNIPPLQPTQPQGNEGQDTLEGAKDALQTTIRDALKNAIVGILPQDEQNPIHRIILDSIDSGANDYAFNRMKKFVFENTPHPQGLFIEEEEEVN